MVAPARSRSPESAVESRPTMSALDRVLKAVRAGWTDYNNSAEASVAAQARFARRIGHGDTIQIEGETWRIIDITKGDDEAPVIIENGKIHRSIASLDLERVELAARLIRSVDEPEAGTPAVVSTGTRREPVVVSETAPVGPKVPLRLRYGAVDVSEAVEDRARDTAEESLHAEKKDAGFFAKIFKHNIAYEVYRQIAISRSRSKILSEKNLYASDNFDRDAHRKATGAVVDRFLLDHEEFLHSEGKNGEKKKVFGDSAEEKVVKKELEALVREYATNPDMDAAELAARRDEIFASANKLAGDAKGRGVMHADNLEKLADQVRQQAAHAGGLANLDLDLEIVIGKAKLGARTEREKNLVDKALDKLERWGKDHNVIGGVLGAFRNEIAVALGTTYAIGNLVARTAMSSTAGKLMTFGGTALVSGAYGWWKEKGRLNSERSLHERQMSLGGETRNNESASELAARESTLLRKKASLGWWQVLDKRAVDQEIEDIRNNKPLQPRRKEMEGFELARESAKTLALGALGFLDASGKALRGDVSVADATTALADIEARIRISNKEKIDLLKYTNVAEAEVERRNLDMARMQLKAALRSAHDGAFSTADKKEYKDFQAYFDHIYSLREGALYGRGSEAQKQQKKFADWSQRVAVKRGLTTMAIGAGIGLVGHELWALGTGGDTTIGSTWAALKAYFDNAPVAAAGPVNVEAIGGGMFTTPPGTDLVPQADGSFVLESTADHSAIASGLHIDPAGHLDAASIATLRGVGANIVETDQWVNSSSTVTTTEGTWDWLRHHFMQKIHRDNWMDNDTPMYLSDDLKRWLGADLNELKLEWGGIMGPDGVHPIGLDANGQIVMTMGHMTPDGSFHDALSENAPAEIVERKVRLLLTMNSGSQNSAIELMSDQHGQFHIDPNSDIGKTFFRVEHGKVVPLYYHAEVGISKGFDASGVNHFNILATHIGKGTAEGITSTDIGECIDQHVTEIGLPTSHDIPPVAIPPFVPIRRRQPMEPLKKGKGPGPGPGPGPIGPAYPKNENPIFTYYNGSSFNEIQNEFKERGIQQDPYTLKPKEGGKQVWTDKEGKEVRRDIVRERARIAAYLEKQDAGYLDELRAFNKKLEPMTNSCRVAVIIPARLEEKNLANLLDQYVKQIDADGEPIDKDLFEINILVNRKEGEAADRSIAVMEDWKRKNPGYHVNAIDIVFPKSKANVGMARKYVTDLSLMRSLERGSASGPLYIESEDADLFSVDKRTIGKLIKDFDAKPYLDVLRGIQDRQPEMMSKNDLFFFERRLWDIGEMVLRDLSLRPDKFKDASHTWNRVISGGWNTAYTAEAYAQIGGYVPDTIGEDMKIGQKISVLRGQVDPTDGQFKSNTYTAETSGLRANSSPRRFLDAMVKQENAYDSFEDQSVKEKSLEDLLAGLSQYETIAPEHRERYEGAMNTFYNFVRGEMSQSVEADAIIQRALFYLGLKVGADKDYVIDGEHHISLTDSGFARIGELLKDYKEKKTWKKGYKRQNSPLGEDEATAA